MLPMLKVIEINFLGRLHAPRSATTINLKILNNRHPSVDL